MDAPCRHCGRPKEQHGGRSFWCPAIGGNTFEAVSFAPARCQHRAIEPTERCSDFVDYHCELPAGHAGEHRSGAKTWILSNVEAVRSAVTGEL